MSEAAPAIAGWAAEEFGFPNRRAGLTRDPRTNQYHVTGTG